jgi:ATP-dependent Zn protease
MAMMRVEGMDQKKLRIAHHETGHAVMALICRQGIKWVSLKEMDSPKGTDKYLGSTKLEPFEQEATITINESIRRVRISLGGYASEILFTEGSCKFGGDDLTEALKWINGMMQSEGFRNLAAKLPAPTPGTLDMIENPTVRAFIHYQIGLCIEDLKPLRRQIQLIAEKLYESEELTGDEVSNLFNSIARSHLGADQ